MISGAGISLGSVIPINDIRGLEGMSYSKNEKLLRCKLAAVYRLFDMYGWTQNIYNHISVIRFLTLAFIQQLGNLKITYLIVGSSNVNLYRV